MLKNSFFKLPSLQLVTPPSDLLGFEKSHIAARGDKYGSWPSGQRFDKLLAKQSLYVASEIGLRDAPSRPRGMLDLKLVSFSFDRFVEVGMIKDESDVRF